MYIYFTQIKIIIIKLHITLHLEFDWFKIKNVVIPIILIYHY